MTLMFKDVFGTAWPMPVDRIRSLKTEPTNETDIRWTEYRRVKAVRITLEFEPYTFLQVYVGIETAVEIVKAMTNQLLSIEDFSPGREYQMVGRTRKDDGR